MLYKDILKKLLKQNGKTMESFAAELGLGSQQAVSQRLRLSWNPGMADAADMLGRLGYEVAFVPKGTLERNAALAEVAYVPEFPPRPEGR